MLNGNYYFRQVVYVGKPDDKDAQESLVRQFEDEWSKVPVENTPRVYVSHHAAYMSEQRKFTAEEIERLSHGETVYILRRLEYADKLGLWLSEDCQHMQSAGGKLYTHVNHPCLVFYGNRLPLRNGTLMPPVPPHSTHDR